LFFKKKLIMNTFDGVLVKYGSNIVGYSIMGLPLFFGNSNFLK